MNMLILVVAILGIAIAGTGILAAWRRSHTLTRNLGSETLACCENLLLLLAKLQQHRGISSAYLAGDNAFLERLQQKAEEITALLPALKHMARIESRLQFPCLTVNEVSLFRFRWDDLRSKIVDRENLTVEQSIAQHNFLVSEILKWLSALGEARLTPLVEKHALTLVHNYAERLPALSECLGQARALGSAIAASQQCSSLARIRLMFLMETAEKLLLEAQQSCGEMPEAPQSANAVHGLLKLIRSDMLATGKIQVEVEFFFQLATDAIEHIFAWAHACREQIERTHATLARSPASR